jgi:hypothetical protein
MNRTALIAALIFLTSLGISEFAIAQENVVVFEPEAGLTLTCQGEMMPREHELQRFLQARGFQALDLSQSNDHSGRIFPQNAEVIGVDAQRRIVELSSHDSPDINGFSLTLTAPPSGTPGTVKLRGEFESFARQQLGCTVTSVHYGHNNAAMASAYDEWADKLMSAISGHRTPRS